jgi:2'-5' RNA ligase
MGYFVGVPASDEFDTLIKSLRESISAIDYETLNRGTPHITIAHLGKQRPDTERYQDVGASCQPFELSIEGVRIFRNTATTHLVLPVVQGEDELRGMHTRLRPGRGIPDRDYSPHMTLASAPSDSQGESQVYQQMLAFRDKYAGHPWGRMVVVSFHLFSSSHGVAKSVDQWRMTSFKEVM